MLGLLDVAVVTRRGDARRGRRVRVVAYPSGTAAALFDDEAGAAPRGDNFLTCDDDGRVSAYCAGRFQVLDDNSSKVLIPFVEVGPLQTGGAWGEILGDIADQQDLIDLINTNNRPVIY